MVINSFGAVGECLFQLDIAANPADRFYFDIIINGNGLDGITMAWLEPHPCRPVDRWRAGGAGYRSCVDAGFCTIGHRCVAAMAIIAGAGGDCISDIGGEPVGRALVSSLVTPQIGEISFVLKTSGVASGIFTSFEADFLLAVIAASLFLSPIWSGMLHYLVIR